MTEEELQTTLRANLEHPEVVDYATIRIVIDDLPLYPNGEINRRDVASVEYIRDLSQKREIKGCKLCLHHRYKN